MKKMAKNLLASLILIALSQACVSGGADPAGEVESSPSDIGGPVPESEAEYLIDLFRLDVGETQAVAMELGGVKLERHPATLGTDHGESLAQGSVWVDAQVPLAPEEEIPLTLTQGDFDLCALIDCADLIETGRLVFVIAGKLDRVAGADRLEMAVPAEQEPSTDGTMRPMADDNPPPTSDPKPSNQTNGTSQGPTDTVLKPKTPSKDVNAWFGVGMNIGSKGTDGKRRVTIKLAGWASYGSGYCPPPSWVLDPNALP